MPTWLFGTIVAVVVVALGFATMWGLTWITGRGDEPACDGEVDLGYAPSLTEAAGVEPFFQAVNERCQFWLAIDGDSEVVAYKPTLPGRDCRVRWDIELERWSCGVEEVEPTDLEQWRLRVNEPTGGLPTLVIDFGPGD